MNIRRVLCPTDLTSHSLEALHRAASIANRHDAELHVLHILGDTMPPLRPALSPWSIGLAGLDSPAPRVSISLLDWVRRAQLGSLSPRLITRRGQPATAIVDYAKEASIDIIVMASYGRRPGLVRLLQPAVAESVRLRATAPVLTVRLDTARHDPCERILCAVDLEEGSEAAIIAALALADQHDAEVRLLHVIDRPSAEDVITVGYSTLPSFVDSRQQEALAALRGLIPKDARAWRQSCARVMMGTPADVIVDAAREWSADLIVLGPQRRRGLSKALFGSTTETVVRQATASVLSGAPAAMFEEEQEQVVLRWQRVQ